MENTEQSVAEDIKIPGIDEDLPELEVPDELTTLKEKADLMGLTYHPSIGVDKLRTKVAEAIAAEGTPKRAADAETSPPEKSSSPAATPERAAPIQAYQAETLAPAALEKPRKAYLSPKQHADAESVPVEGETIGQKRLRMKRHANELIRVRVTCMNPAKKEWEGEIIAAGNNLVGTLSKYVPFGNDEGWHIPRIMYNVLRDRMCQIFITITDPRTKQKGRTGKQIKEFAVEVLEPLTTDELQELAQRQAMSRSID